jgi:hypothetical protein
MAPARAAPEPIPAPVGAFFGFGPVDPFGEDAFAPGRLALLDGLGTALVQTTPIAWGRIEPRPPLGGERHLYDWEPLDAFFTAWQGAGFEIVPVLTTGSSWACVPPEDAGWAKEVRVALPASEAAVLLAAGTGATPPRADAWAHWQRFVEAFVARYGRRGVRWIQILDRPTEPDHWAGDEVEYLRLLHHASQGAEIGALRRRDTGAPVHVLHGALDFATLGRDPFPDEAELERRAVEANRDLPVALAFQTRRSLAFALRTLEMNRLVHGVPQVGSPHAADEAVDLRFLRRFLDVKRPAGGVEVWLEHTPTEKLGDPRVPVARHPTQVERRLRSASLAAARRAGHADHAAALAWLERGRAYDLVRTICAARLDGASRVVVGGHGDAHADAAAVPPGFVRQREDGSWTRTPSWYAARQAIRLLGNHATVEEQPLGAPGRAVRFEFAEEHTTPWVLVLVLDPDLSWAGAQDGSFLARPAALNVADGRYVVEETELAERRAEPRTVTVEDGTLLIELTPAPVYVYPDL